MNCSREAGSTPISCKLAFTCGTWLMLTSAVVSPGTERANCSASDELSFNPSALLTNAGKF